MSRSAQGCLLFALLAISAVNATVFWDKCLSESDHPEQVNGDYYNLCIKEEEFEDRHHSWKFTKANIEDTTFKGCTFENRKEAPNNFTNAVWTRVTFDSCKFGSIDVTYGPNMTFDHTVMTDVKFINCEFDHTVTTVFDNFEMNHVEFDNCTFKGNTIFQSGTVNIMHIRGSKIVHNPATMEPSEDEAMYFRSCTINTLTSVENQFVNPVRFEGVQAQDVSFNESEISEFYCHGPDNSKGQVTLQTEFTSTAWDNCEFKGKVYCDETTWQGFYAANITFHRDADFSRSKFVDIYWDEIQSKIGADNELTTLNFSNSKLNRRMFANISIDGRASFEQTQFTRVRVKNFFAKYPNFDSAIFHDQEYIDGQCCSQACPNLKCRCNVTEPSGLCPVAGHPVNMSATQEYPCFPGDATVRNEQGHVLHLRELMFGERVKISHDSHSDVYFFGHRSEEDLVQYTRLSHSDDAKSLRISPTHYLYVNGQLRTAGSVCVGDRLRAVDGTDSLIVSSVDSLFAKGAYAPTTLHGDVVVDDVIVSSYTDVLHPTVAHKLLAPVRFLYRSGWHSIVRRLTMFEQTSWANVARTIGIGRGPEVVSH